MQEKSQRCALVTNASGFAGAAAVDALLGAGFRVFAQDETFKEPQIWRDFARDRTALECLSAAKPEEIITTLFEKTSSLEALICNDHYPAPSALPEDAPITMLHDNYTQLVEKPFRIIQSALPHLKKQGGANIVMITSNRMRLPLSGGAFPDAMRAAANAMVRSLAIDCAKDGIIINAIAPNFLYSEAYYPRALFKESDIGRDYVRQNVPVGRLAEPHEIGEVIAFLATVETRFLTGAVIDFSGGWPFGASRPTSTSA